MKQLPIIMLFLACFTTLKAQTALTPFELTDSLKSTQIELKIRDNQLHMISDKTYVMIQLWRPYTIYKNGCQIEIKVIGAAYILFGTHIIRFDDCTPVEEELYHNTLIQQEMYKIFY